jgi:hypothetical protein
VIVDLETRVLVERENGGYSIQDPDERTARQLGVEAGAEGIVIEIGE